MRLAALVCASGQHDAGRSQSGRGRSVGTLTAGLFAGQFLSPILAQPVIDTAGLRPTFLGIAAASTLTTLGYTMLARREV